jgi:hypothetical protein
MELARTKDGFLFDEVAIKRINFVPFGTEIVFEYTRNGRTIKELQPLEVHAKEWAATRAASKTKEDFANTDVVKRLFASGARQYNERSKPAEEDFAADMAFLESLRNESSE